MFATQFVTVTATSRTIRPARAHASLRLLAALALSMLATLLVVAPVHAAQPTHAATDSARSADGAERTKAGVPARAGGPRAPSMLPFALAADVRLRAPGTSRFAGEYVGAAAVDSVLSALCHGSLGTVAGVQAFAADTQTGAVLLLRSARAGDRREAWHEVLVYRLDDARRVRALELYVEDQRAWDRRYPREDGVSRISVATERNVAHAQRQERRARFVAGNGDRVLMVLDQPLSVDQRPNMPVHQTTLVQQVIAPSGSVRTTLTYAPLPNPLVAGAMGLLFSR